MVVGDPAELYKHWCDFKVSPMAGNVQIVFYNKKQGTPDDVLVKFMLNEKEAKIPVATDCFPFYRWKDVRSHYASILAQ